MAVMIRTAGVHHVALRAADFDRSKKFYLETLGFPVALEADNIFLFLAGKTAIGVRGPEADSPDGDQFDPFRVGLDHVALACDSEQELERVAGQLSEAGVWNTGVKMDETLGKRYVAFKDPDGIKWELYMA
jgi:glyoxylase I family protein